MILFRPVSKQWPVSQRFGENPSWYPLTNGHNGIDYSCPEGTPLLAAADGVVIRADIDAATVANPKKGYGYHVRIRHLDDSMTIYGHLRQDGFAVNTGDTVKMGDVIGYSGNTGFSTGPHLHFELRGGVAVGTAIDPEALIVDEIPSTLAVFQATITPSGDYLNLRAGPSTKRGILKQLRAGTVLKVFAIAGTDVWLRVEEGFIKYDPNWEDLSPAPEPDNPDA